MKPFEPYQSESQALGAGHQSLCVKVSAWGVPWGTSPPLRRIVTETPYCGTDGIQSAIDIREIPFRHPRPQGSSLAKRISLFVTRIFLLIADHPVPMDSISACLVVPTTDTYGTIAFAPYRWYRAMGVVPPIMGVPCYTGVVPNRGVVPQQTGVPTDGYRRKNSSRRSSARLPNRYHARAY